MGWWPGEAVLASQYVCTVGRWGALGHGRTSIGQGAAEKLHSDSCWHCQTMARQEPSWENWRASLPTVEVPTKDFHWSSLLGSPVRQAARSEEQQ